MVLVGDVSVGKTHLLSRYMKAEGATEGGLLLKILDYGDENSFVIGGRRKLLVQDCFFQKKKFLRILQTFLFFFGSLVGFFQGFLPTYLPFQWGG